MQKSILLLLFFLQLFLPFKGVAVLGIYWNPVLLLLVSLAVAGMYWYTLAQSPGQTQSAGMQSGRKGFAGALIGLGSASLCYIDLQKVFAKFTPPGKVSDVLPQLEMLYSRFAQGEMPYTPVDVGTHVLYPVYMPFSWLPIGLAQLLGIDSRWAGFILFVLASGVYGYFVFRQNGPLVARVAAVVMPSFAVWAFTLSRQADIAVCFEMVIASYYLLVAAGLLGRNNLLVAAGIALCLLSRFTLVFWLPLFALLLWQNVPKRQNFLFWGAIAAAVLLFYVVPFLSKDPAILKKGMDYYNEATVLDWKGYGEPPVSWTIERGVHFAGIYRDNLGGEMAQRVQVARTVQAGVMLLLLLLGVWGYRRLRNRIHYADFGLLFLSLFLVCYYVFAPLTYRYYLLVPFTVSAVVCGQCLLLSNRTSKKA
jgi:hypothetical protein